MTMNKIDSVMTNDGYRKRWELVLDEFSPPEIWIEGVGSESGVLNSGTGIFLGLCGTYSLLCSSDDGNQVYQNPEYEGCYYNLLDDGNFIEEKKVDIFYQPQHKRLLIKARVSDQIVVTNISGIRLYQETIRSEETTISTLRFQPGLYVITVIGKSSVISNKIMIR